MKFDQFLSLTAALATGSLATTACVIQFSEKDEPETPRSFSVGGSTAIPEGGVAGQGGGDVAGASGAGGAGGADRICLGDESTGSCPSGEGAAVTCCAALPKEDCTDPAFEGYYVLNPLDDACNSWVNAGLRDGVREAMVDCLRHSDAAPCSQDAVDAVEQCATQVFSNVCPKTEAATTCESHAQSPLTTCDDGTLTQQLCTSALSARQTVLDGYDYELRCADPAGEYADKGFTGSCAERLISCMR